MVVGAALTGHNDDAFLVRHLGNGLQVSRLAHLTGVDQRQLGLQLRQWYAARSRVLRSILNVMSFR